GYTALLPRPEPRGCRTRPGRVAGHSSFLFFFNDTATPEISPLPLHAALPISGARRVYRATPCPDPRRRERRRRSRLRSEEQTSELQSLTNLACRLRLVKI